MFRWFKSKAFHDPELGEFVRSRGQWRGTVSLDGRLEVPLALSGNRSEPDAPALGAARELAGRWTRWRPAIENALFDHYSPYAEALAEEDLSDDGAPNPAIATPDQVWSHVTIVFVSIAPLDGLVTTELGYTTAWDEEHTLGVRFQSDTLIELCGSVLAP